MEWVPPRPRIKLSEQGDANVRVDVPRPIWLIATELGREYGIKGDKAVRMLLKRLGDAFVDPRRAQVLTQVLGPDVGIAVETARRSNFGAIASGAQIDLSKLARSTRLKSGFDGVVQQGNGWRADARSFDGIGLIKLGVYQSPEEAAWVRFLYYEQHSLPYGAWEAGIDRLRKEGQAGSDAELIQIYEETNRLCGQEHLNQLPGRPKNPSAFVPRAGFETTAIDSLDPAKEAEIEAEIVAFNKGRKN